MTEVFCYGDKRVLKDMLFFFFQIATRSNDLGEFDCNYYINNCRFWWGCFSIPHSHYSVYVSLWKYFPASVEYNSQNSDVFWSCIQCDYLCCRDKEIKKMYWAIALWNVLFHM